ALHRVRRVGGGLGGDGRLHVAQRRFAGEAERALELLGGALAGGDHLLLLLEVVDRYSPRHTSPQPAVTSSAVSPRPPLAAGPGPWSRPAWTTWAWTSAATGRAAASGRRPRRT